MELPLVLFWQNSYKLCGFDNKIVNRCRNSCLIFKYCVIVAKKDRIHLDKKGVAEDNGKDGSAKILKVCTANGICA